MTEIGRIREAYSRRDEYAYRYSLLNPSYQYEQQQRERVLVRTLKYHGFQELGTKKILDVGCGEGRWLRRLVDFGALPENLCGIDLLPDRITRARLVNPSIDFCVGDSEHLPYDDGTFDIVAQFTMFTSILDDGMKRQVAREMLRVLAPGGIILWYDYHMNNPRNPDARGVGRKEIYRLFPGCSIMLKRVTLAPPLARQIVPRGWIGALLLEKMPFLCTHYLGIIRKPNAEAGR